MAELTDVEPLDWLAQVIRLTLFVPTLRPAQTSVWQDLVGVPPAIDENRIREGVRREAGPQGNGELEAIAAPSRLDINLTPVVTGAVIPAPHFGPADAEIANFVSLIEPWLAKQNLDAIRIAFGAVLVLPAKDRVESYDHIARFVPSLKVDPANSKELLYRINRPKNLMGMEINRVTTWNSITARGGFATAGMTFVPSFELNFARLEVDNSTPAERIQALDSSQLVPIFKELVAMALENAARGEIP